MPIRMPGEITDNPFAAALSAELTLDYDPKIVIAAQRDAVLRGLLAIVENLQATREAAERLGIGVEACQARYQKGIEAVLAMGENSGASPLRMVIANIPSADGTDVRLVQIMAPRTAA
jgi:hypothetical protein